MIWKRALCREYFKKALKVVRRHPVVFGLLTFIVMAPVLTGTVIGRVVDASTGKPIEDAVVMSVWVVNFVVPGMDGSIDFGTKREIVTGKGGWFFFFRPTYLLFKYPSVTVYKEGYVIWNNKYSFGAGTEGDTYWNKRAQTPIRFRMKVSLRLWEKGMSHRAQGSFIFARFTEADGTKGRVPLMVKAKRREGELSNESRRKGELP